MAEVESGVYPAKNTVSIKESRCVNYRNPAALRQQIRRLRMEGKRVALVPIWVICTMAI